MKIHVLPTHRDMDKGAHDPARHRVIITRQMALDLLEENRMFAKAGEWPLIPIKSLAYNNTENPWCSDYTTFELSDEFLSQTVRSSAFYNGVILPTSYLGSLHDPFRLVSWILELGEGHIAAAGSYSMQDGFRYTRRHQCGDVDFFFHSCDIPTAERIRIKIRDAFLALQVPGSDYTFLEAKNTSTMIVGELDPINHRQVKHYQLVHRIHKNLSSIIGTFDMGSCSALTVLEEGKLVSYVTPLGAFAARTSFFFVDVERASPSFAQRIVKNRKRGFIPAFLCMSEKQIRKALYEQGVDLVVQDIAIRIGASLFAYFSGQVVSIDILRRQRLPAPVFEPLREEIHVATQGQEDTGSAYSNSVTNMNSDNYGMLNAMALMSGRENCFYVTKRVVSELGRLLPNGRFSESKGSIIKSSIFVDWSELHALLDDVEFINLLNMHRVFKRWFDNRIDFTQFETVDQTLEALRTHTPGLLEEAEERLAVIERNLPEAGVIWFGQDDDPGRQFKVGSSGVNPGIKWYNPDIAVKTHIGVPFEVCCTMLVGLRDRNSPISIIGKDCLNIIMKHVRRAMVTKVMF